MSDAFQTLMGEVSHTLAQNAGDIYEAIKKLTLIYSNEQTPNKHAHENMPCAEIEAQNKQEDLFEKNKQQTSREKCPVKIPYETTA